MTPFDMARKFNEDMPKPPHNLQKVVAEIGEWIRLNQEALLLAWFAQYGFEPGKAVLVHRYDSEGTYFYIREANEQEKADMQMQRNAFDKTQQ